MEWRCIFVIISIMFTSFLERSVAGASSASRRADPARKKPIKCRLDTLDRKLQLGAHVSQALADQYGNETLQGIIANITDEQLEAEPRTRFPYGFWKWFTEQELNMMANSRQTHLCARCFWLYIERQRLGGDTNTSRRDGQHGKAKRKQGCEQNATKAKGLSWALLQYFVDEIQVYRSRVDSAMLLEKAKEYRDALKADGWPQHDLPKLEENAGAQWLARWRIQWGLSMKSTGMKLKVLWSKVKSRCSTHLTNIWRLRALWDIVHPGIPMRFLSADQKPSWFNNSGHTGSFGRKGEKAPTVRENFAKSRERYTILTVIPSWTKYRPEGGTEPPPHVFILFKGKKNGRIIQEIRRQADIPDWMHIQVQECGSYREVDVLDALRVLLPVASDTTESIIVMLDWFSAHRCESVIEFIESRGHIVLFHGGGCTPFTQINDTHMHGVFQTFIIQLENQLSHAMRVDMRLNNDQGIPTLSRIDIIAIVETAWQRLDHAKIAQKGYVQTGPCMPMDGAIRRTDVQRDLISVLNDIDPPQGLQEVGQKIRDDAKAFVAAGYPSKWSSWLHAKRLIIEHDCEDDPVPEGFEAYGYEIEHDDAEDDDFNDHPGEDSGPGDDDGSGDDGDAGDDGGPGGGAAPASDDDGDEPFGEDLFLDGGAAPVHDVASGASDAARGAEAGGADEPDATLDVVKAREVMIQHYRKNRNDTSLKRMLRERDSTTKEEKASFCPGSPPTHSPPQGRVASLRPSNPLTPHPGQSCVTAAALTPPTPVVFYYLQMRVRTYVVGGSPEFQKTNIRNQITPQARVVSLRPSTNPLTPPPGQSCVTATAPPPPTLLAL